MHPVNKGLVPIHYKYFVRNLTLHHFLLSPEAWNMRISIKLTSYTSSKPDSVATFSAEIKSRNGRNQFSITSGQGWLDPELENKHLSL